MADDTCYIFPCRSEHQAGCLHAILTSQEALDLVSCLSFQDNKRVVTKEILGSLDLAALAENLGIGSEYDWHNPLAQQADKAQAQKKP